MILYVLLIDLKTGKYLNTTEKINSPILVFSVILKPPAIFGCQYNNRLRSSEYKKVFKLYGHGYTVEARSSPERAVRVRALARDIVLCS